LQEPNVLYLFTMISPSTIFGSDLQKELSHVFDFEESL